MEQADRVALRIVGAETVGADHFSQAIGLMRGRHVPAAAHFGEADLYPGLCKLPRRFRSGEAAADDVHLICHAAGDRLCAADGKLRVGNGGYWVNAAVHYSSSQRRLGSLKSWS